MGRDASEGRGSARDAVRRRQPMVGGHASADRGSARPSGPVLAGVLTLGVLAVSTGALFTRAAFDSAGRGSLGGGMVLALVRLALTSVLTAPSWLERGADRAATTRRVPPGTRGRTLLAGGLLGLHFATWLPSLAFTSIAASVTIVTTGPVWVALILWLQGQRPSGRALLGIAVAIGGGALVALGDVDGLDSGSNPLLGNALALVAAVAYAAHLLLGRSAQHRGLGLWQWTSAVTAVGTVTVIPVVALTAPGDGPFPAGFWAGAVALALVPQMVGHSSFTWAVRWLSPTLVSVVLLFEPLVSSLGGVVLFDEVPGAGVVLGGVILLVGVAVTTHAERPGAPLPVEQPVGPT